MSSLTGINTLQVRWHGQLSGLHILGRNKRKDNRMEGGVWYENFWRLSSDWALTRYCRRLPMARVWPPSHFYSKSNHLWDTSDVDLPQHKQDRLIDIYFTYVHPIFPVIHKTRFLSEYHSRCCHDISLLLRDSSICLQKVPVRSHLYIPRPLPDLRQVMAAKTRLPLHPRHFPLLDQNLLKRSPPSSSYPCLLSLLVTQKKRCRNHKMGRCGKLVMIFSSRLGNSLVSAQALLLIAIY